MYAIFAGLFVAGIGLGYFISQQQIIELRLQISDIVSRISEKNSQIMSLQSEIGALKDQIKYYKAPLLLEYIKSGGIAGIEQTLAIDEFGSVIVNSTGVERQTTISQQSVTELKDMLIENNFLGIVPVEYTASANVADFFTHSLTVTIGDVRKQILWVDSWASQDPIPQELLNIQTELSLIYDSVVIPANANTELRNGLKLTVKADKTEYLSDDVVHITTLLENLSPNTITYTSPTPCDLDIQFIVKTDSTIHDITYANREPIQCIQVLQSREFLTGAVIMQEVEWDKTITIDGIKTLASSGVYVIEAKFPLANFEEPLVTSSISIQITE
jgi:hypothetical protein